MLLVDAVRRHLNQLLAEGRSRYTVRDAKSGLRELLGFVNDLGVTEVAQLDHDTLLRYREEIAWRLTPKGTPLTAHSQLELIGHVHSFGRFLVAQGWLLSDLSAKLPRPKKPRRLPRSIMEPSDVERILARPDVTTPRGYRDRVMLEILYSTAVRREELARLHLDDVDCGGGYVFVREGKGRKDRVVPLGKSVCGLVQSYLVAIRPEWVGADRDKHLLLNRWGNGMKPNAVWCVVRKYARAAGVDMQVSTHTFRHACATHMLRNGAPIRQLQEMLGHPRLRPHSSTRGSQSTICARCIASSIRASKRRRRAEPGLPWERSEPPAALQGRGSTASGGTTSATCGRLGTSWRARR